jgi:predicted ferric reductase
LQTPKEASLRKARYFIRGAFWVGVYLLLVTAPLFILLIGPLPEGRGFWTEFSVALGFVGLAIIGLQFGVTARFRWITSPFGIDVIYHFHRQISLVAIVLIVAHPVILFIIRPETLALLNPVTATWPARFGLTALLALLILVGVSLWRERLRINYEAWRLSHGVLATLAVSLALLHILGINHYIATPWKRTLWVAFSVGWVGLLFYVRVLKPFLILRRPYRVTEVVEERGDCWTLVLRPENHDGIDFKSGQFVWLNVWHSPIALTEHPFSIASSALERDPISLTIKDLGDFTSTIREVPVGKRVYVDGPYGSFTTYRERADRFVFIAGGIGITPIMSMVRTHAGRNDPREFILIYANKDWDGVTFREELEALQQAMNLTVTYVLEDPPEGWDQEVGFVTEEIIRRAVPEPLDDAQYFICGPDPMMDAVEAALHDIGVPLGQYHSERYKLI